MIVTGEVPVNAVASKADLERGNHSSVTEHAGNLGEKSGKTSGDKNA